MQVCQNPNCSNPFNSDSNKFCISCGHSKFGILLRSRYRVLKLIGEGGFSRTYLAEDVDRLDAPCVIKQFFPQVEGTGARMKAAELFKEEAFRLYDLGENHLQIPRLLAYFQQGSSLYLVQEFIPGETLFKELRYKSFTEAEIWQILADLLPVLDFIHSRNVIHRDIKPENIIRRQSDNQLVLIDFGGAKQVTQTSLARQATAIYTIGYAPSEQMAGFACQASDLYALGVTCVRLLTQCLPLQDPYGQIQDRLYDAMNGEWLWRERLQEKGVSVSEGLGKILDKLLKHLAKERYQSAAEALRDLQALNLEKITVAPTIVNLPQPELSPSKNTVVTITQQQSPPLAQTAVSTKSTVQTCEFIQTFDFEIVTVDALGKETSRKPGSAKFFAEDLGNKLNLEMVLLPQGTFIMGSPPGEGDADERPQHQVSIESFFMGKYPITQAQWRSVAALPRIKQTLNPNPSKFKGANRPVENISWYEAVEFCARLREKTGRQYRLPSEAEWEYACRAGTTTPFHFGDTITSELANCNPGNGNHREIRKGTKTVGTSSLANAFGLYDMHGQVWEWCADSWHPNYQNAPTDGSAWESGGDAHRRVLRGGSWSFSPQMCRSASRSWNEAVGGLRICGFRVVATFFDWNSVGARHP
ncbi:MAG: bifunctional serine/threonine-protein kinase/formylglycine-generating enzyme family protein [Nostocaceae cyanobacterium]|nr:bifunctional serine/threonine-protein kinase/formylglycine-generating enzyme family protein [Nostocaceae cyanobacterium]